MKKKIIWVLVILLVLVVVIFALKPRDRSYGDYDDTKTTENVPVVTASSSNYTLADISSHNSKDSCWSTIDGKVYDFTSFIGKHPGGEQTVLDICGKDGSQLFDGKHGMDQKAKSLLPRFYLGELVK